MDAGDRRLRTVNGVAAPGRRLLATASAPEAMPEGPSMRALVFVLVLVASTLSGCATTETVRETAGQGVTRTYARSFDDIHAATLAVAKARGLDVVEDDRAQGRLLLAHGVTLWIRGERIAVFIRRIGPERTEVEVVSKPVLAPLNFPPDWQKLLLDEIGGGVSSAGPVAAPSVPAATR